MKEKKKEVKHWETRLVGNGKDGKCDDGMEWHPGFDEEMTVGKSRILREMLREVGAGGRLEAVVGIVVVQTRSREIPLKNNMD
ncbi:hypothetical protein GCK72_015064 [Caenorhabditis remanei]|uniref:Uncharacterized protein n=1 Tax=Caenorhabditis remanei TaxID=31234 RepID=A0A6A5GVR3_CAERE|nr:hypothetical protein GCK72_015064 [Caenorhabditis remanei]KAF1758605.1 hypothetical protein GCK72_015064 [Caenorhabditis remanei]